MGPVSMAMGNLPVVAGSRSANQILQDRMRELVQTALRKFHARLSSRESGGSNSTDFLLPISSSASMFVRPPGDEGERASEISAARSS
jgi:hypothetical protein